jgi:hypothetical protein
MDLNFLSKRLGMSPANRPALEKAKEYQRLSQIKLPPGQSAALAGGLVRLTGWNTRQVQCDFVIVLTSDSLY